MVLDPFEIRTIGKIMPFPKSVRSRPPLIPFNQAAAPRIVIRPAELSWLVSRSRTTAPRAPDHLHTPLFAIWFHPAHAPLPQRSGISGLKKRH